MTNCDLTAAASGVGIVGYGMGASNAHLAASNVYGWAEFNDINLKAAVMLHNSDLKVWKEYRLTESKTNSLWIGGTADKETRDSMQYEAYEMVRDKNEKNAMVFWGTDVDHGEPGKPGSAWTPQTIRWLNCHIKDYDCGHFSDTDHNFCRHMNIFGTPLTGCAVRKVNEAEISGGTFTPDQITWTYGGNTNTKSAPEYEFYRTALCP